MIMWVNLCASPGRGERGGKVRKMKFPHRGTLAKIIIPAILMYALLMTADARIKRGEGEALMASLQHRAEEIRRENELLRREIDSFGDAELLASMARERLGLVFPDEKVFYDPSH